MKAVSKYDPADHIIFIFENGKGVKIPITAYETKTNRRKLTGAYSASSPIAAVIYEHEPMDIFIENSAGKGILINSALIPEKTTRSSAGVILFNMKDTFKVTSVTYGGNISEEKSSRCRKNKIPATGISVNREGEQISLS